MSPSVLNFKDIRNRIRDVFPRTRLFSPLGSLLRIRFRGIPQNGCEEDYPLVKDASKANKVYVWL